MRIDRMLHFLRFCKTRSLAQRMIGEGHVRCNGARVLRPAHEVVIGDIIAFPLGQEVRIIELCTLPARRGPAQEAQSHYRRLDPGRTSALAGLTVPEHQGDVRS